MIVEYDGSAFAGWQKQPDAQTVQSCLEKALSICLRRPCEAVAAGRTDAGVHASGQVVHIELDAIHDAHQFLKSINALTPPEMVVSDLCLRADDWHARYSAQSRVYHYKIACQPIAIQRHTTWYVYFPLNADLLKTELHSILGTHDFKSFSIPRNDGKSTECTITRSELVCDGNVWTIIIEGNRFLHRMVRALVGAAVDVARGAHPSGFITRTLRSEKNEPWTWAPAHGLCLVQVDYPNTGVGREV